MGTMKITINDSDWTDTLDGFASRANRYKAEGKGTATTTTYEIEFQGKLDQDTFDLLIKEPCTIDNAELYVRVPQSSLDNLVDVDLPDSKYTDENGDEQRRNYLDYFTTYKDISKDGTEALVRVAHRKLGARNPVVNVLDAEIRAWLGVFGSLIVPQEYNKLMATDEWKQEVQE